MHPVFPVLFLAAGAAASAPLPRPASPREGGIAMAQVTIRERIVIRVPAAPPPREPAPAPMRWVEKGGPKCVAAGDLAGAIVTGEDRVDLVLKGSKRVRAVLDDGCDGLGSYGGFYIRPSADGKVCAGRDAIRTRLGDTCPIRRFRRLVAKR